MATEFPNKITESIYTQIIVMFYLIFLSSLKKKKRKKEESLIKGHVFTQFWNTHLDPANKKLLSAISTNSCYYIWFKKQVCC